MTTEEMTFWLDVLKSPAVIALAGGLAGSLITLIISLLKFWRDSTENQKTWERKENLRREERAFEKKSQLYEEFCITFNQLSKTSLKDFIIAISPCTMKIMLYGTYNVRKYTHDSYNTIVSLIGLCPNSEEYKNKFASIQDLYNKVHESMMEDLDCYCERHDGKK